MMAIAAPISQVLENVHDAFLQAWLFSLPRARHYLVLFPANTEPQSSGSAACGNCRRVLREADFGTADATEAGASRLSASLDQTFEPSDHFPPHSESNLVDISTRFNFPGIAVAIFVENNAFGPPNMKIFYPPSKEYDKDPIVPAKSCNLWPSHREECAGTVPSPCV